MGRMASSWHVGSGVAVCLWTNPNQLFVHIVATCSWDGWLLHGTLDQAWQFACGPTRISCLYTLLPHVHGTDGFFMARWIRRGSLLVDQPESVVCTHCCHMFMGRMASSWHVGSGVAVCLWTNPNQLFVHIVATCSWDGWLLHGTLDQAWQFAC